MGLSVASWRKKKRRGGSDKSAHDLGRDKLKMLPYCESTEAFGLGKRQEVMNDKYRHNGILHTICRNGIYIIFSDIDLTQRIFFFYFGM